MKTSRLLVLAVPAFASLALAQNPEDVYSQLRKETFYVHPKFGGKLDTSKIRVTAEEVKPYNLKVLVVPALGQSWRKGSQENRDGFAKYVAPKIGQGTDGITIVLTNKGIAVYNPRLSSSTVQSLQREAVSAARSGGADAAISMLAKGAKTQLSSTRAVVGQASPIGTTTKSSSGSFLVGLLACIAIPAALAGGIALIVRKAGLKKARKGAEEMKNRATEAIAYLDSYDGLIDDPKDAGAIRQYRDRMAQNYEEGLRMLARAKNKHEIEAARRQFALVSQDMESAKRHVDHATGGTGMAFSIPPIVDQNRAPLFEPVAGVSYFSSQPSDMLVPVEINAGGQRRTVMVTPDERDMMMRGQMPQMRGSNQGGQFVPWYGVRGYDPYRHYDSRDFLWDMMAINAVSHMMMPHYGFGGGLFGGYGHGYHDHGTTIINNYGDSGYSNSTSGDFDFGSSNDSGGGFDFGSSSSGDFDFGGGGDSGGFDFGGGDSGGGDFGGGGDF